LACKARKGYQQKAWRDHLALAQEHGVLTAISIWLQGDLERLKKNCTHAERGFLSFWRVVPIIGQ
jgi:hypothetical protein